MGVENVEHETGTVELEIRPGSALRVAFSGFGWGIVALVLFLSLTRVVVDLFGHVPGDVRGAAIFFIIAGSIVVPIVLLYARQRPARLTWDDWGVTEWDGDGVRVAIPWNRMRYDVERRKPRLPLTLLLTDGEARRIKVATSFTTAGVRCRRRLFAERHDALLKLIHVVEARAVEQAEPLSFDDVSPARLDRLRFSEKLGTFLAGTSPFIGAVLIESSPNPPVAPLLFGLAAIGLALRAARPARELASLRLEARRHGGGRPVDLIAQDGELLTARLGSAEVGEEYQLDTTLMGHPDSRLAERRGPAFVVFDRPATASSPYRGTSPAIAPALETPAIRAARQRLTGAVAVELVFRGGLAVVALLVTLGAVGEQTLGEEARSAMRLQSRCLDGRPHQCTLLADRYASGRGVERAPEKATRLYQEACNDDSGRACFKLAQAYEHGRGVEVDLPSSANLYLTACSLNHREACTQYGQLLSTRREVDHDVTGGCRVLERACTRYNRASCGAFRRLREEEICNPAASDRSLRPIHVGSHLDEN